MGEQSFDEDSSDLHQSAASEGNLSAPDGRHAVNIDVESLDAGVGSADGGDDPVGGKISSNRRSRFAGKRSMSLEKLEMEEVMNRSESHISSK